MSKYELPEDVSLYLLSVAGSDVSGAALALCRKYMPEVVEAYMESSQECEHGEASGHRVGIPAHQSPWCPGPESHKNSGE